MIGKVVIAVVALSCMVVLWLSVYPGLLADYVLIAAIFGFYVIPATAVLTVAILLVLSLKGQLKGFRFPWKHVFVVLSIMFATFLMLLFYVPRRLAFEISRNKFSQAVTAIENGELELPLSNLTVGMYHVDECMTDEFGAIYLRTHSRPDGFSPDQMHYGFAYKPNRSKTPYGAAHYQLHSLGEGWYWFRVSDDY